jgi:hypothetical protein
MNFAWKRQMDKVNIVKHKKAIPLKSDGYGDILLPFKSWQTTDTGDGWFSKIPDEFYTHKLYYPLTAISQNPWEALQKLLVQCYDFKESVTYECPYNGYLHFWAVPVFIFADNVKFWTDRFKTTKEARYLDADWMRKYIPSKIKDGLPFTKVQRALLGPGYTSATLATDGNGHINDAIVALSNNDFLGVKVWIWFNSN